MKRIVTKKERERRDKRNKVLMGTTLVVLMFLSVLGFAFGPGLFDRNNEGEVAKYNGLNFVKSGDYWIIGGLRFKYHPNEVPNIGHGIRSVSIYEDFPLYIYSENENATREIETNMIHFVEEIEEACLEEFDCPEDVPIKTCNDNFIIIKENNISEIYEQDNCVFIKGPQEELVKLTDQFLFKAFGVR